MKPAFVAVVMTLGLVSMIPLLPTQLTRFVYIIPPAPTPVITIEELRVEVKLLTKSTRQLMDRVVSNGEHEVWPEIDKNLDRLRELNRQLVTRDKVLK